MGAAKEKTNVELGEAVNKAEPGETLNDARSTQSKTEAVVESAHANFAGQEKGKKAAAGNKKPNMMKKTAHTTNEKDQGKPAVATDVVPKKVVEEAAAFKEQENKAAEGKSKKNPNINKKATDNNKKTNDVSPLAERKYDKKVNHQVAAVEDGAAKSIQKSWRASIKVL